MPNNIIQRLRTDPERLARIEALRDRVAANEALIEAERRQANIAHLNRVRRGPRKRSMTRAAALARRWVGHWEAKIARLNAMAANPGYSE